MASGLLRIVASERNSLKLRRFEHAACARGRRSRLWHAVCSSWHATAVVASRSEYGTENAYGPPRADLVTTLIEAGRSVARVAMDAAELRSPASRRGRLSLLRFLSLRSNGGDTMVAINRKRVRCVVVAVPVEADAWSERGALAHELVPGADPYVAQLIQRLQDEVRHERRMEQLNERAGRLSAKPRFEQHQLVDDLEVPWFDMPFDDEPLGEENVPEFGGDANDDVAPAW
jgi:hypothetical protein